jgi:hypothetical protein
MKINLLILIFVFVSLQLTAQRNVRDSIIGTPWIGVHYSSIFPQADLASRYGYLNHIGTMAGYKTSKNYFWGIDADFIFGNQIKIPDIFHNLRDNKGNITDINGDIATVVSFVRGFHVNAAFGKVFPVLSPNKNSGLFIHGGIGYSAIKIRVETNNQVVPQIELNYRKGYDRLTTGVNIHQFIGYALMSNRGVLNFYGGFYFQQGFTRNVRNIFFDQPDEIVSKKIRNDFQAGIRFGWFIPIYKRLPKEFYYD